jgi:hypothetical protein
LFLFSFPLPLPLHSFSPFLLVQSRFKTTNERSAQPMYQTDSYTIAYRGKLGLGRTITIAYWQQTCWICHLIVTHLCQTYKPIN